MSVVNNRTFLIVSLVLIAYSIIAGMFTPLSPNVEKLSYEKLGDSLYVKVYMPKSNENLTEFFLMKSTLKREERFNIPVGGISKIEDGYELTFINPEFVKGVNKGSVFDFVAVSPNWGKFYYFNALFTDTAEPKYDIVSVTIPNVEVPFHFSLPNRSILKQSIRNLFFHVPMWFAMMALLFFSLYQSVMFLYKQDMKYDLQASKAAQIAIYFGIIGLLTGMVWARYTWGAFWTSDPKLNGTAIGMLAYLAYFILRRSVDDDEYRGKLAAVYNIFAFALFVTFIIILPRINDSLHPGNGGNPGFNIYEQDNIMRMIFYPAVIGWIMFSFWLKDLYVKAYKIDDK